MINLLICNDTNSWELNSVFMDRDRCLTEYIIPELKSRFAPLGESEINQLKLIPCIFAYEQVHRKDAYIGYITDITVRQSNVKIECKMNGEMIRYDDFINLTQQLDIGTWELNRTHWTIKNANLKDMRPYFSSNIIHKSKVFISYSWTPIENQKYVFDLVSKLTYDGVSVVYDKNDLLPGQDKNYFMENVLTTNNIDFVLVICNEDYAAKADERRGGVGYESEIIITQLQSQPLQRKIIPVVIETNKKGEAYLPAFLKSRLYIDLTRESGYNDLLSSIKS